MAWLTTENFTPKVIILLILMAVFLLAAFFSDKLSRLINLKYKGDFSLFIKLISFVAVTALSVIILLIIRG
ncbi:MAG: hypothetical protein ACOX3U_02915 [Christensenellales bacterium]|jgi:hypothetical protein